MKSFTFLAAVSALTSQVSAHYIFQQFTYGGTVNPVGKYIRPNTNYNSPITDMTSINLRCNEGGALGATTDTLVVSAGQSFSFTSDTPVYHNGPISIYMAKAPSTASAFDGSGTVWFKIWEKGPTFNPVTWPLAQTYTATFPAALPNGNYLVRIEQIGLHNPYPAGLPQFYLECAQVTVTNGGSGVPGPLVAIPGHVLGTEASYTVNIYNNFNSYSMLGPPVWTGGNGGGATTTASRTATTTPAVTTTTTRSTTTSSRTPVVTTTSSTTTTRVTTTLITTTSSRTTTPVTTTTTAAVVSGSPIPKYGKCGGEGWTGGTACVGSVCTFVNQYYSQCL